MRATDIPLFLIGHRGAIQRVAGAPMALLVGGLLCLTAGVARHYDHEYFLAAPWKLLIGLAVAMFNAFVLYVSMNTMMDVKQMRRPGLSWLGMFLMTAPLAWVYAIPVERLAPDVYTAAKWNLWMLAIVSAWRVLLMLRCMTVVYRLSPAQALVAMFTPLCLELVVVYFFSPIGLMSQMAGIWVIPPDMQLLSAAMGVMMPVALYGGMILLVMYVVMRGQSKAVVLEPLPESRTSQWLVVGVGVLLAGMTVAALPWQRQVQRLEHAQALVAEHDVPALLAYYSAHERADFGQVLPLPPSPYNRGFEFLGAVLAQATPEAAPDWLREELAQCAVDFMARNSWIRGLPRNGFEERPSDSIGFIGVIAASLHTPRIADYLRDHPEQVQKQLEQVPSVRVHPDWWAHADELVALGITLPGEPPVKGAP